MLSVWRYVCIIIIACLRACVVPRYQSRESTIRTFNQNVEVKSIELKHETDAFRACTQAKHASQNTILEI
jgi:hypothetical protein